MVAEYSTQQSANPTVSYLTTDHLGTPRVITDKNGNVISRRDMMPFGEDLYAGVGSRTGDTGQKYSSSQDDIRQKFTGYPKDKETNLDFAEARYYNNLHGRFTAVDPLLASGKSINPQTFNRYCYTSNNPVVRVDINGKDWWDVINNSSGKRQISWFDDDPDEEEYTVTQRWTKYVYNANDERWYALDPNSENSDFFFDENAAKLKYGQYTNFKDLDYFACNLVGCGDVASLVANMRTGNIDGALYDFGKISIINGATAGIGKFIAPTSKGVTSLGLHEAEHVAATQAVTSMVPKATRTLGKWGETRLAQVLANAGEKPAQAFSTSLGNRFVDRLVNGIAHEAKAGLNVGLTSSIRKQILKDAELIAKDKITGAHWHFFQGATQETLDFLTQNGIKYTIH
jgi:RHS repeat-associated protein